MSRPFMLTTCLALVAALCLPVVTRAQSADEQTGALIAKLEAPDHRVEAVAFSPDGRLLAAGYGFYDDGGVTIWRVVAASVMVPGGLPVDEAFTEVENARGCHVPDTPEQRAWVARFAVNFSEPGT